jgi:CRP-like cAMP-binding protein
MLLSTKVLPVPQATSTRTAVRNNLLAGLPAIQRRKLLEHGQLLDLKSGASLSKPGTDIAHVYFPVDCIVTRVAAARNGSEVEVGLVGNEGMLGITLMLGVVTAPTLWLVQSAGRAWTFEAETFLRELVRGPDLQGKLHRYLYVLLVQLSQNAICKRFHVVEARLARWLLMTRDRAHADHFHITHENLAHIMGVRRAGITRAASTLQRRRIIQYNRGDLHILDGAALEAASCGCYRADKDIYAEVMGRLPVQRGL